MNKIIVILTILAFMAMTVGCGVEKEKEDIVGNNESIEASEVLNVNNKIIELENGLSAVAFEGDYGFDKYISHGGASSDREVIDFLKNNVIDNMDLGFRDNIFGCSTITVQSPDDEKLFGRNFDWNNCNAMVVKSKPENGYASISTVNMDFIKSGTGLSLNRLPDNIKTIAALYAPLDGMNEKGLCVAVNMIQDSDSIKQNSDKPDITTTTAIRLLLDKAANTDEAMKLLKEYDMHSSMNMMVHFAISDAEGKSVAVEYINNEMIVTETPVLTNFYVTHGEKYGIGTTQSHERYDILVNALHENNLMTMDQIRDVLNSVSKDNFNEYESTEWSIVFNQTNKEIRFYHRENYDKAYIFNLVEAGD